MHLKAMIMWTCSPYWSELGRGFVGSWWTVRRVLRLISTVSKLATMGMWQCFLSIQLSWLMAVDCVGRNAGSWCYIQGSTCNHEDERKTINLGWMLHSVYAALCVSCTLCMLHSVYAALGVCCTRCMMYSVYAILGVCSTWWMLYLVNSVLGVCCTRCMLYSVYAVHGICWY